MSIIQDEAKNYWDGPQLSAEWSYFEDGFDTAVEAVGTCFQCEYPHTEECLLDNYITDVNLHDFYCASFENKEIT